MLILIAVWLLAIGYGALYAGISSFAGHPVGMLEGLTKAGG